MKNRFVCCFTGHRAIPEEHFERLSGTLDNVINKLIKNGVTTFRAGGALGFDTFAALKVLEKKQELPEISLELYLPCKEQSKQWSAYNKKIYEHVISQADKIIYTSENYFSGCMLLRNRVMVDGSDFCVAYCLKNTGGTAYTYKYAKTHGVRTVNLVDIMKYTNL